MIVVGIDPSLTSAGVAVLVNGCVRALRHVGDTGSDSDDYDDRSLRVHAQAQAVTSLVPAGTSLVVMEGPAYESVTGNAFDRAGLWQFIYTGLRIRGYRLAVVPPPTLKKFATDDGRADKEVVRAACKRWYPKIPIRVTDESDALTAAVMGAAHIGEPLTFELAAFQRKSLRAVAWGRAA